MANAFDIINQALKYLEEADMAASPMFEFKCSKAPWTPKGDPSCSIFYVRNPIDTKFSDFRSWIKKKVKINNKLYTIHNVERETGHIIPKGALIGLWVK